MRRPAPSRLALTSLAIALFMSVVASGAAAQFVERVSAGTGGGGAGLSADGRFVLFHSGAALVPGDTNGLVDVYLRDRQNRTTVRVSLADNGAEGNGHSFGGAVSGNGTLCVFRSQATNLAGADSNGTKFDVFLRDLVAGRTIRLSDVGFSQIGAEVTTISTDGRFVAWSVASDGAYLHDRQTGQTRAVPPPPGF